MRVITQFYQFSIQVFLILKLKHGNQQMNFQIPFSLLRYMYSAAHYIFGPNLIRPKINKKTPFLSYLSTPLILLFS